MLHQVGALTLVRRDDADLLGFDATFEEACHDLLYVASLSPVLSRKETI